MPVQSGYSRIVWFLNTDPFLYHHTCASGTLPGGWGRQQDPTCCLVTSVKTLKSKSRRTSACHVHPPGSLLPHSYTDLPQSVGKRHLIFLRFRRSVRHLCKEGNWMANRHREKCPTVPGDSTRDTDSHPSEWLRSDDNAQCRGGPRAAGMPIRCRRDCRDVRPCGERPRSSLRKQTTSTLYPSNSPPRYIQEPQQERPRRLCS